MSEEDEKILKKLEEAVNFGIGVNRKGLNAGQTMYLHIALNVPEQVAQVFIQKYKRAGWSRIRLYMEQGESGEMVIELAKPLWRILFEKISGKAEV